MGACSFEGDNPYTMRIGGAFAPACYSGISGQGNTLHPQPGNTVLVGFTPLLDPGVYDVVVTNTDTSEEHTLAAALTVRPRNYQTEVFAYKKLMPPRFRAGARSIGEV
jgi:hypothetical protein